MGKVLNSFYFEMDFGQSNGKLTPDKDSSKQFFFFISSFHNSKTEFLFAN